MGTLFRLNTDFVTPAAGTKVLKAEEYGHLLEADKLLAERFYIEPSRRQGKSRRHGKGRERSL